MTHEEAIEAMGHMRIDDLQPTHIFDDDFVSDGDPKYKVVHEAWQKADKANTKYAEAKRELAKETQELSSAKKQAKTLENVVDQKEAALQDAKENINATGTEDEKAVVVQAEKALEASEDKVEEVKEEIEDDAAKIKEAKEEIPKLEEEAAKLRKEHGEKYQAAQEAREAHKPIQALEEREETVDGQLKKVEKIKQKLLEEKDNVTATLDTMSEERAIVEKANQELADVADRIEEVDAKIKEYKETQGDAESGLADAQKTDLPKAQGEVIYYEEKEDAAKDALTKAEEDFDEGEYKDALAEEKQVDQELEEAKEEAEKSEDVLEEKEHDVDDAQEDVAGVQDGAEEAVEAVHQAEQDLTTVPPTATPPEDLTHDNPGDWLTG